MPKLQMSESLRSVTEWRNTIGFIILGTINNAAYCCVGAAAASLANSFGAPKLLGLVTWANVALGFVVRSMNTWMLEETPFKYRIWANAVIYLLGLIGVAVSTEINFAFCLSAIVLVGAASSFGESVILGYLRRFPGELVGAWSIGTGIAGVGGTGLYIVLFLFLSNSTIFYILTVFVPIYLAAFFLLIVEPYQPLGDQKSTLADSLIQSADGKTETFALNQTDFAADESGAAAGEIISETKWQRCVRCVKLQWWYGFNLLAVYFLEYVVSTAMAHSANTDCKSFNSVSRCADFASTCVWDPSAGDAGECSFFPAANVSDHLFQNAYAVLSFCYQFGVLISRSSLKFVQIRRIGIITILQLLNFILWLLQDKLRFVNVWGQCVLMIFVGLLGGASYVNIFHELHRDPHIPTKDKELVINITALCINFGIVLAACGNLILDHTILADTL